MDDDDLAYMNGEIYLSEYNGCITDVKGDAKHLWADEFGIRCEDWQKYFKRI